MIINDNFQFLKGKEPQKKLINLIAVTKIPMIFTIYYLVFYTYVQNKIKYIEENPESEKIFNQVSIMNTIQSGFQNGKIIDA